MRGTEKNNRSKGEKRGKINVYRSSDCEVKMKVGVCEGRVRTVAMGAQREFEPGDASRDLSFVKKGKFSKKEQRGIVGQQTDFVLKWLSRVGSEVGPTKGNLDPWASLFRVHNVDFLNSLHELMSLWTLVPVRLDKHLSGNSTVGEIASEAADCHLTYTMANCPQRW
ncbi:hypothetical protein TNCV_2311671 [Trichonephila clavipes]|nr:hypothetical protein TNCV_2311671 [Trichonephila clavipes]